MSVARGVSARALRSAARVGITADNVEALLLQMAALSAIATSHHGNRRYGDYYLTVEGGIVTDVQLADDLTNCSTCDGTGVVYVPHGTIRCPECTERN